MQSTLEIASDGPLSSWIDAPTSLPPSVDGLDVSSETKDVEFDLSGQEKGDNFVSQWASDNTVLYADC